MSTATSFICPECQRVLRTASPVAAGKKIRCPACNTIFAPQQETRPASPIRRAEEAAYPARRPAAEIEPAGRRQPAEEFDDDYPKRSPRREDDRGYDDDRPRARRARKKTPWGMIIGGSAALLLLVGFGVTAFIWPGFLRSSSTGGGSPPTPQVESLLAFLPADPLVVFGADLSRLEKRNKLDELFAKLPAEISKNVPALPPELQGVVQNVETVVGGLAQRDVATFAARTKAAFNKQDILRNAKAGPERDVQGVKIASVPGQFGGRDTFVHLDPDNKLMVFSQASEAEFVAQLKNKKGLSGDAKSLVQRIGGSPVWFAVQIKGEFRQEFLKGLNPGGPGMMFMDKKTQDAMKTLRNAKAMAFWAESKDTVTLSCGFVCASAGDAGSFRSTITDSWNREIKPQLRNMAPLFQMAMPPGQGNIVNSLLKDLENSFQAQSNGDFVWLSVTFSNNTARELADAAERALPMLAAGGAFPRVQPKFDKFGPPPFVDKGGFNQPPIVGGKIIMNVNAELANTDPFYPARDGCHYKTYTCKMMAGKRYQIDMIRGPGLQDSYLYLEDETGNRVAFNDDAGGNLNARIVYSPTRTADHRIIATTCGNGDVGGFTLTVREQ